MEECAIHHFIKLHGTLFALKYPSEVCNIAMQVTHRLLQRWRFGEWHGERRAKWIPVRFVLPQLHDDVGGDGALPTKPRRDRPDFHCLAHVPPPNKSSARCTTRTVTRGLCLSS